jgi:hypothetical protein
MVSSSIRQARARQERAFELEATFKLGAVVMLGPEPCQLVTYKLGRGEERERGARLAETARFKLILRAGVEDQIVNPQTNGSHINAAWSVEVYFPETGRTEKFFMDHNEGPLSNSVSTAVIVKRER